MSHDSQLQQSVLAEFEWEPSVTAGPIGVTANAGVVTLTGHVDRYARKHAAETVARRVNGVEALAEEIEVRLPFEAKRSDEDIAAAAIERLSWNVSVPKDSIQVKVAERFSAGVIGSTACSPIQLIYGDGYAYGEILEQDSQEIERETNVAEAEFRDAFGNQLQFLEWRSAVVVTSLSDHLPERPVRPTSRGRSASAT